MIGEGANFNSNLLWTPSVVPTTFDNIILHFGTRHWKGLKVDIWINCSSPCVFGCLSYYRQLPLGVEFSTYVWMLFSITSFVISKVLFRKGKKVNLMIKWLKCVDRELILLSNPSLIRKWMKWKISTWNVTRRSFNLMRFLTLLARMSVAQDRTQCQRSKK